MLRVSVVIPTLNRAELVLRAVRSVLAQTMPDLEVLVLIDGQDPQTEAALAKVDDERLQVLPNPENLGAGRTRDRGAALAAADWVAFLDDDDEWLPQKLEKQLELAAAGPAVITAVSRVIAPYGQSDLPNRPYNGIIPFDEWMFDRRTWLRRGEGFFQTSSLMLPKAAFEQISFTQVRHEDWEIGIRAVKQLNYAVRTVAEPMVLHYRDQGPASLSHQFIWKRSLIWAEELGPLLTRRAHSGFLLGTVARDAQGCGDSSAIWPLLRAAFLRGNPTGKQLFAFTLIWGSPRTLRRSIRSIVDQCTLRVRKTLSFWFRR